MKAALALLVLNLVPSAAEAQPAPVVVGEPVEMAKLLDPEACRAIRRELSSEYRQLGAESQAFVERMRAPHRLNLRLLRKLKPKFLALAAVASKKFERLSPAQRPARLQLIREFERDAQELLKKSGVSDDGTFRKAPCPGAEKDSRCELRHNAFVVGDVLSLERFHPRLTLCARAQGAAGREGVCTHADLLSGEVQGMRLFSASVADARQRANLMAALFESSGNTDTLAESRIAEAKLERLREMARARYQKRAAYIASTMNSGQREVCGLPALKPGQISFVQMKAAWDGYMPARAAAPHPKAPRRLAAASAGVTR